MARRYSRYPKYQKKPDITEYKALTVDQLDVLIAANTNKIKVLDKTIGSFTPLDELQSKVSRSEREFNEQLKDMVSKDSRAKRAEFLLNYVKLPFPFFITCFLSYRSLAEDGHAHFFLVIGGGFVTYFFLMMLLGMVIPNFFSTDDLREQIKQELLSSSKYLQGLRESAEQLKKQLETAKNNQKKAISEKNKLETEIPKVKEAKKKAKERERSAKIAAIDGKARQGSQSIKTILLEQVKGSTKNCPYCNTRTNKKDLVLDHIHPVAKGGQTVLQNSVLVCGKCNSTKRALTVRAFCKKAGLDYEELANKLERQGKWV
jgi:5-methylcytosine-specific restriction endonuclease McrA